MGWKTLVPANPEELYANLLKLHENKKHVNSIKLDETDRMIRVDLDWAANSVGGVADFQIPVKARSVLDAREIVGLIKSRSDSGQAPSRDLAERLFSCVDASIH